MAAGPIVRLTPEFGWLVAGGASERLYVTRDGAETWQKVDLHSPIETPLTQEYDRRQAPRRDQIHCLGELLELGGVKWSGYGKVGLTSRVFAIRLTSFRLVPDSFIIGRDLLLVILEGPGKDQRTESFLLRGLARTLKSCGAESSVPMTATLIRNGLSRHGLKGI